MKTASIRNWPEQVVSGDGTEKSTTLRQSSANARIGSLTWKLVLLVALMRVQTIVSAFRQAVSLTAWAEGNRLALSGERYGWASRRGATVNAQVAPGGTCHALLRHSPPLFPAPSSPDPEVVSPSGWNCFLSVPSGRRGVSARGENTPASQRKTFWAAGETVETFMTQHPLSHSFPLGQTVITRGALDQLHPEDVYLSLRRHAKCDWGDCCAQDKQLNDEALTDGCRLLSAYRDRNGVKFWIITEADRSATTILLPDEY